KRSLAVLLSRLKSRESPPVVRFGKFPPRRYSGKMGRDEAVRVFVSNLSEVWDLSVEEAARLSGYTVSGGEAGGDKLFIWVFLPTHPREVVPATWGRVFRGAPQWLKESR